MGSAKEWILEQQQRGYDYIGEKYVCADCFNDYAIKEFISEGVASDECSYCHKKSKEFIAAEIDDVLAILVSGISCEWQEPNGAGVPNDRDSWGMSGVVDSYDLIFSHFIIPTDNRELLEDIHKSIRDRQWCKRPFWALSEDEALIFGWENFVKHVKHQKRYFFMQQTEKWKPVREEVQPTDMLGEIEKVVKDINLIQSFPSGKIVYRVRCRNKEKFPLVAAELGTPLEDKAIYSNRMSPAGVPMFYGALEPLVAIKETVNNDEGEAALAEFRTLKNLKVLNLMQIDGVPSIFDSSRRHQRSALIFLQNFVQEISKSIEKDGREHIEYVPTQIVTEYFRHVCKDGEEPISGIFYPSSKLDKGVACVLFVSNEQCCDKDSLDDTKILFLEKAEVLKK